MTRADRFYRESEARPLVEDDMMQAALEYLAKNTHAAAAAKAERVRAEHGVKQAKARAFMQAEGPVAQRDAEAIASDEYATAVEREAKAVEQDEWHRNQRTKADAIISAWQTENANRRAGNNFR